MSIEAVEPVPDAQPAKPKSMRGMLNELALHIEHMGARAQAAVALQIAATCEEQLKERLLAEMKVKTKRLTEKMFTHYGPWSTFAGKADTCYALGLIDDYHYTVLRAIIAIRNEFAHSHNQVTFKSEVILAEMRKVPGLDLKKLDEDAELLYFILAAEVESCHKKALGYLSVEVSRP